MTNCAKTFFTERILLSGNTCFWRTAHGENQPRPDPRKKLDPDGAPSYHPDTPFLRVLPRVDSADGRFASPPRRLAGVFHGCIGFLVNFPANLGGFGKLFLSSLLDVTHHFSFACFLWGFGESIIAVFHETTCLWAARLSSGARDVFPPHFGAV